MFAVTSVKQPSAFSGQCFVISNVSNSILTSVKQLTAFKSHFYTVPWLAAYHRFHCKYLRQNRISWISDFLTCTTDPQCKTHISVTILAFCRSENPVFISCWAVFSLQNTTVARKTILRIFHQMLFFYQDIKRLSRQIDENNTTDTANLEPNKSKNRWVNVLPCKYFNSESVFLFFFVCFHVFFLFSL